jgi:hypothetical protein
MVTGTFTISFGLYRQVIGIGRSAARNRPVTVLVHIDFLCDAQYPSCIAQ